MAHFQLLRLRWLADRFLAYDRRSPEGRRHLNYRQQWDDICWYVSFAGTGRMPENQGNSCWNSGAIVLDVGNGGGMPATGPL
ncbi:hypothetical protein [Streptomyces sp. NPDC059819]|uniref:hypothetical protein n=1 Tax=Streptomyces sp. NPDC059819 TaxID=3346963 RepID=UPI0036507C94